MFHSTETTAFNRRLLPHWEVRNGRYFVTLNLWGALPGNIAAEITRVHAMLKKQPDANRYYQKQREIFARMEYWLHQNRGDLWLNNADVSGMIMNAIRYYERQGIWRMDEYVIMPNHGHLFFQPNEKVVTECGSDGCLFQIMDNFKRWTGRKAQEILNRIGHRFWMREWFDHWARDEGEAARIIRYIQNNPVKAGLARIHSDWPYASWAEKETQSSDRNSKEDISDANREE